jgi:hypothetical protein
MLLDQVIHEYTTRTGRDLYLLGRSGRHCCVSDTPENSRQYQWLRKIALRLEADLIKAYNHYDPQADTIMGLENDIKTDNNG